MTSVVNDPPNLPLLVQNWLNLCARGTAADVSQVLRLHPHLITKLVDGESGFHTAIRERNMEVVGDLLEKAAHIQKTQDLLRLRDDQERLPVHAAALNGDTETLRLILAADAPAFHACAVDEQGATPVMLAALKANLPSILLLLEAGADLNQADLRGDTPLMYAIRGCPWPATRAAAKFVAALIQLGAHPNAPNCSGMTPLMLAAKDGRTGIATVLLDHHANALAVMEDTRDSALHLAAKHGREGVVELLLRRGAPVDALNASARTPEECSINVGCGKLFRRHRLFLSLPRAREGVERIRLVKDYLAERDFASFPVLSVDGGRRSLLAEAVALQDVKLVQWLTMPQLLRHSPPCFDPNAEDDEGFTALARAAAAQPSQRAEQILARLLQVDDPPVRPNHGRRPALAEAARAHSAAAVALLLGHKKTQVDAGDANGTAALHVAAFHDAAEILQMLLEKGARVNGTNSLQRTPLWFACHAGKERAIGLLLRHGADPNLAGRREARSEALQSCLETVWHFHTADRDLKARLLALLLAHGAAVSPAMSPRVREVFEHGEQSADVQRLREVFEQLPASQFQTHDPLQAAIEAIPVPKEEEFVLPPTQAKQPPQKKKGAPPPKRGKAGGAPLKAPASKRVATGKEAAPPVVSKPASSAGLIVTPDSSEAESDSEEEWEVEEIRDFSEGLYEVKWKGWDSDDNTWEPASNLQHCPELLRNFKMAWRAAKAVIRK